MPQTTGKYKYWWPKIKNNVKKYVQGCMKFQQNKVQYIKKVGELYLLEIPEELWCQEQTSH